MSAIATMLEEHREEQARQAERRRRAIRKRKKETAAQARATVRETLGEVYEEIEEANPDAEEEIYTAGDGLVTSLVWRGLRWGDMPPFSVTVRAVPKTGARWHSLTAERWSGRYEVHLRAKTVSEHTVESDQDISAFFVKLDEQRQSMERQALQDELVGLQDQLIGRKPVETEEEARAVVEKIVALAPDYERFFGPGRDLEDTVGQLFADWQEWRRREDERLAKTAENRRKLAAFEAALREWGDEWRAAGERNQGRLAEVEERFDEEITVYALAYGVVATDEDGESYADTRKVTVLPDGDALTDEDGFWRVLHGGKVRRVRYEHAVSLEGPLQKRTGVFVHSGNTIIGGIICAPGREREAEAALAGLVEQWEPRPEVPDPKDFDLEARKGYDVGGRVLYVDDVRRHAKRATEPLFDAGEDGMLQDIDIY